jgi:hypothetical protein
MSNEVLRQSIGLTREEIQAYLKIEEILIYLKVVPQHRLEVVSF